MGYELLALLLAVPIVLLLICLVRALACRDTTGEAVATDPARAAAYAEKLAAMVRCETVSSRDDGDAA